MGGFNGETGITDWHQEKTTLAAESTVEGRAPG